MQVKELARNYRDYTIGLRRHFHAHPEASLMEFKTRDRIMEELDSLGIAYEVVGETGLVAEIKGAKPGRTLALRADIDALELDDLKDVSYKSKNPGLNHACGHDGHTSMLLTAGRILQENRDQFQGKVLLIFQPAEELISGAKKMLKEKNFLEEAESILGIHLISDLEVGSLGYCYGASMSSADSFVIKLQGKGGHGSSPQNSIDPLVAACALVNDAQHIVSREISPWDFGVVTFGIVSAGSRHNIIPDSALIEGTIRSYDNKVRTTMKEALERIAKNISSAYRTQMSLEFPTQTFPVVNDKAQLDFARKTMEELVGEDKVIEVPPSTGSEDFSYFLEKVPGIYLQVGAGNDKEASFPHHHPRFDIDEDSLEIGVALYCQYALDFLSKWDK